MDERRESEATPTKNRTAVERKSERELVTTRDLVDDGYLHVVRIASTENAADIFTKPLGRVAFEYLRDKLGLRFALNPPVL